MPRFTDLTCLVLALLTPPCALAKEPLVRLRGTDFLGGAASLYGSLQFGQTHVNYIYAEPTGGYSVMTARFELNAIPDGPFWLYLLARLDELGTGCPIRVTLNDGVVLEGPGTFGTQSFTWGRWPIPDGLLRNGVNTLVIRNISPQGSLGGPPWFMLASCAIAGPDWDEPTRPFAQSEFFVTLPSEMRPLPEPLPEGRTEPGFRLRGIKGWLWRPEQYLAEIPVLARYKMNFLMNCYGSMCDIEHYPFGAPECNRWWEPLPEEKKRAYEAVVRACQEHGIEFCFSLNPNFGATRIVDYNSPEDLDLLWQHYDWMQSLGVRWFNLQFDDISEGIDAAGQARVANALLERLRARDPGAQMILCPTFYWGTGNAPGAREYLDTWARELHPDIYVFWTGDDVVTPRITREAAQSFRDRVGHRLFIWDNYPVNDGAPTLHLGPVTGRDPDLCEVADGYMSNPLSPQNEANRIPLLTCADYAYNPWAYDPLRSIGQAILHLADTPEQARALADLVELYPGMNLHGKNTGYNPVLDRFQQILAIRHSRYLARLMLAHVEDVRARMATLFPDRFADAVATMDHNLDVMRGAFCTAYPD